jgi:hypothetical protein
MGIVSFIICGLAAYLLDQPDTQTIFNVAAVNAGLNLWSFGVMSNYRDEPMMAPNFWTNINMLTTLVGVGLLGYSFFI